MKHIILSSLLAAGIAPAATIQVDFGLNTQLTTDLGWNNMTAGAGPNPADLTSLVDSAGNPTLVDLTYTESGTNAGVSGAGANYGGAYPATIGALPTSALQDGLYFQSGVVVTLALTNLNPGLTYDFVLYGARGNNGGDSTYTANGLNSGNGSISNVFNNGTEVVSISGISPTAGGAIDLVLSQGASPAGAGALNIMTVTSVPEPGSFALLGLASLGLLRRRRG